MRPEPSSTKQVDQLADGKMAKHKDRGSQVDEVINEPTRRNWSQPSEAIDKSRLAQTQTQGAAHKHQ